MANIVQRIKKLECCCKEKQGQNINFKDTDNITQETKDGAYHLTQDIVGNGTAQNPQYPVGNYLIIGGVIYNVDANSDNIYVTDGKLLGLRIVDLNGHELKFRGNNYPTVTFESYDGTGGVIKLKGNQYGDFQLYGHSGSLFGWSSIANRDVIKYDANIDTFELYTDLKLYRQIIDNIDSAGFAGQVLTKNINNKVVWADLDIADEKVKVSSNDNTAGYLEDKIQGTTSISILTQSDLNNNEAITIDANNTDALWNANKLQGKDIGNSAPLNKQILSFNSVTDTWEIRDMAVGYDELDFDLKGTTNVTLNNNVADIEMDKAVAFQIPELTADTTINFKNLQENKQVKLYVKGNVALTFTADNSVPVITDNLSYDGNNWNIIVAECSKVNGSLQINLISLQ